MLAIFDFDRNTFLGISACGHNFESNISQSIEHDNRVGLDTDTMTRLLGRGGARVTWTSGTVKLCLKCKCGYVVV